MGDWHQRGDADMIGMAVTSLRRWPYPASIRMLRNFAETSSAGDPTDSVTFTIGAVAYILFVDSDACDMRTQAFGFDPMIQASLANPAPPRYALIRQGTPLEIEREVPITCVLETDDPDALVAEITSLVTEYERLLAPLRVL